MNPRVHFAIHCVIGITALVVLGYAFSQPLANLEINEKNIKASDDIYITQECLSVSALGMIRSNKCGDLDDVLKPHMQAIMGVVIALMVCIFLECICMNFSCIVSNILGLLVLALSIALIVLVATLSSYSKSSITNSTYNYTLSNTSIGVLVITSLLILFELCCNKLVHRVVLTPYRMLTSKKA